jgi:hypothetical protein
MHVFDRNGSLSGDSDGETFLEVLFEYGRSCVAPFLELWNQNIFHCFDATQIKSTWGIKKKALCKLVDAYSQNTGFPIVILIQRIGQAPILVVGPWETGLRKKFWTRQDFTVSHLFIFC